MSSNVHVKRLVLLSCASDCPEKPDGILALGIQRLTVVSR